MSRTWRGQGELEAASWKDLGTPSGRKDPLGRIPGSFPVEPPEDILFCVATESGPLSFSLRHQIDSPLRWSRLVTCEKSLIFFFFFSSTWLLDPGAWFFFFTSKFFSISCHWVYPLLYFVVQLFTPMIDFSPLWDSCKDCLTLTGLRCFRGMCFGISREVCSSVWVSCLVLPFPRKMDCALGGLAALSCRSWLGWTATLLKSIFPAMLFCQP